MKKLVIKILDLKCVACEKGINTHFEKLGIKELLSAQRRNGLGSLIGTIQQKVATL